MQDALALHEQQMRRCIGEGNEGTVRACIGQHNLVSLTLDVGVKAGGLGPLEQHVVSHVTPDRDDRIAVIEQIDIPVELQHQASSPWFIASRRRHNGNGHRARGGRRNARQWLMSSMSRFPAFEAIFVKSRLDAL